MHQSKEWPKHELWRISFEVGLAFWMWNFNFRMLMGGNRENT
jgi:hypothetical protein